MSPPNEPFIFPGDDNKCSGPKVFKAFYEIEPNFAGRPIKDDWENGADPPDILCRDFSGKRIGVELTEWLIGELVASGKARQRLHDSFSSVIRSDLETAPRNIESVTVEPKDKSVRSKSERDLLRRQLFDCIRDQDSKWPNIRSSQYYEQRDFPNHPILAKYVAWIRYWPLRPSERPSERVAGIEWARFPQGGGYFHPRQMLDRLTTIMRAKAEKYSTLHRQQDLDELYLIVFYSKGLRWNPPYSVPGWGFTDIAKAASEVMSQNAGPFQKVFLFSPAESGEKVLQVWP